MITDFVSTVQELAAAMAPYVPVAIVLAGTAVAAATVVLMVRAVRARQVDRAAAWVSIALATALSAEGMWEVAVEALHLPVYVALCLFAAFEAAMTSAAIHARRVYRRTEGAHTGVYGSAVWGIAGTAGVVAAVNAANLPEALVRMGMPLLAALLWWLDLHGEIPRHRSAGSTAWRISPRRVAIRLGLIEPGDRDIVEVHRDHHIEQLTASAYKVHHGRASARQRHARRLRKLTLAANAEMVDEAVRRLTRVHQIEGLTDPANTASLKSANADQGEVANTGHQVREPTDELREARSANQDGKGSRTRPHEVRELGSRTRPTDSSAKSANPATSGSRTTAEDYVAQAVAAYSPTIELTPAWVMQVTGCAKSTAYTKVLPMVREQLEDQTDQVRELPDPRFANQNGHPSRTTSANGTGPEVDS